MPFFVVYYPFYYPGLKRITDKRIFGEYPGHLYLEDNLGLNGSVNNDEIMRALLELRNTPDRDCNMSPGEVLFGRPLKDAMPQLDKSAIFESSQIHPTWHEAWAEKERRRHTKPGCRNWKT